MTFQMDFPDRNWLFIGRLCKGRSEQLSELKFINFFSLPSFCQGKQLLVGWAGLSAGLSAVPSDWWQGTQKKAVPLIPEWCHWQSLPCCTALAARVSCGRPAPGLSRALREHSLLLWHPAPSPAAGLKAGPYFSKPVGEVSYWEAELCLTEPSILCKVRSKHRLCIAN